MFASIWDSLPDNIEIVENGSVFSTSVAVAYCEQTDRSLSVDCELAFVDDNMPPPNVPYFHEFSFKITVTDLSGTEPPFSTQDRDIARGYIPEGIVPEVMPIVLRSCELLVQRVNPEFIYRVTKAICPPGKAIQKHDLITSLINDMGYTITDMGTDIYGREFWQHNRNH